MSLIGIAGSNKRFINTKLLLYASEVVPSLVIDCANTACPHSLFPAIPVETMMQIYVIELELLYKFRDVLLKVPKIVRELGIKRVIVTTSDHLFNYQDELENQNIIDHAWELLRGIGEKNDVYIGVTFKSVHYGFAKKYCHKLEVENSGSHSS